MESRTINLVREGMLSVADAAEFSSYSQTALYALMSDGRLAFGIDRDRHKRRLIPRAELVRLLATHLVTTRTLSWEDRVELVSEGAMKVADAVKLSGVGRTKLWEWMGDGTLPYLRPPECDRRIPRVALLRLMAESLADQRPDIGLPPSVQELLLGLASKLGRSPDDVAQAAWQEFAALVREGEDLVIAMRAIAMTPEEIGRPVTRTDLMTMALALYQQRHGASGGAEAADKPESA